MNDNDIKEELEEGLYILGGESDFFPDENTPKKRVPWWMWVIIGTLVLMTIIFLVVHFIDKPSSDQVPQLCSSAGKEDVTDIWHNNTDAKLPSCTMVSDTLIDSIHLQIFTPYNTIPTLHVGTLDTSDADIVFATMGADLGYDKGKIIGAFVCEGEPLSWGGGRKLGYCAILDENITLGVSENSPLFEQAIEEGGYFFRQYPAVNNGVAVENNPKNAAYRRALCMLNGKVCVVATFDRVLMNDFASTLVKLGVKNAIFLVGGNAEGWYRPEDGTFHRLGEKYVKGNPNINYIVFRAQ
jgi:hypothetical protein